MAEPTKERETIPVTFRISVPVIRQFRSVCSLRGYKANRVLEDFMTQVITDARQNGEIV